MLIGCCLISHLLVLDPPAADHREEHRLELLAAPAVDDDVDAAVDDHQVPAEDNQDGVSDNGLLHQYKVPADKIHVHLPLWNMVLSMVSKTLSHHIVPWSHKQIILVGRMRE